MIITVHVTQDDIRDGQAGVCRECPVALAIKRALPGIDVHVSYERVSLGGPRRQELLCTPDAVQEFIGRFDSALPVEPFGFTLDIPGHLIPAGATA
jgi:hypothetical protein